MSNATKSEAFHPPGPLLANIGPYSIYETADSNTPPGFVEVFQGEPCGRNRVVQMGPVIRALLDDAKLGQVLRKIDADPKWFRDMAIEAFQRGL